ncbi:MAG: hypothetical protein IJF76_05835 [Clostridia bacterium]|nr:hypothetical protein [Clostridia bacterium]
MKIEKIEKRLKCDVGGCKNLANYTVRHERGNLRNQLNICEECMKKMYALFASQIVPEGVHSKFSKKKQNSRGEL